MKVRRNSNVSVNNFNYLLKLKLSIKFYWHTGTLLTLTDEPETWEEVQKLQKGSPLYTRQAWTEGVGGSLTECL